jgi:hypothetical protein
LGLVRRQNLLASLPSVVQLTRLQSLRGGNEWFGVAAVWRWAHSFPPPYVREAREGVPQGHEWVKTEAEYRDGGDCDDDVASLMRRRDAWGVDVAPELVGNPPRHVRSVVSGVRVDRVPGAPRWR